MGSTITSLIYASFTFIFFALEAAIMAMALLLWLNIPLSVGYAISALVVIPLVSHGITNISRFQVWSQPIWLVLQLLPLLYVFNHPASNVSEWINFTGDAGESVDRDGVAAQYDGGFLQAASWTINEQVTWDRDGITSRDWETYPILGFDNVPEIETILIERPGVPFLGAGEAVSGPTGAAIANAIYNATGLRLRRMPFTPDAIREAAMEA